MATHEKSTAEIPLTLSQVEDIAQLACKGAKTEFVGVLHVPAAPGIARFLVAFGYKNYRDFGSTELPLQTYYCLVPYGIFDNEDTLRDAIHDAMKAGAS